MKPEQIRKMIRAKRFHPFDVRTASGERYHVTSPEFVWMPGDGEVVLIYEPGEGVALIDADQVTECFREIKKRGDQPGTA
jgi:hypothetical protein